MVVSHIPLAICLGVWLAPPIPLPLSTSTVMAFQLSSGSCAARRYGPSIAKIRNFHCLPSMSSYTRNLGSMTWSMEQSMALKLLYYVQVTSCKLPCISCHTFSYLFSSFMQPGCPHFVYGPENTICHGGHYYATCLMQATLQSVVHNFVVGVFITNTTHQPSRLLLRRIILFYGLGLVENRIKVTGGSHCSQYLNLFLT